MPVVLKVWSSNPYNNGGCDFAVVDLTPGFAKVALRRIAVLCQEKALDPSVYETYYWDSAAEYFSPWVNRASQPQDVQAPCFELEMTLEALQVDTLEVVTAPGDFRVLDSQIAAVECAQMIVREEGIAFTAIAKHTDIYLTAAEIPKQVLESVPTTAAA